MASELSLIINIDDPSRRGLLSSFHSSQSGALPAFFWHETRPVRIRAVRPSGVQSRPWDDVDLSEFDVALGIGDRDKRPTGGTFTIRCGDDATEPLPFDCPASILQEALNSLPSVDASYIVTGINGGPYTITASGPGERSEIWGDGSGLTPMSQCVVSSAQSGDDATVQIWHVNLSQRVAAYLDSWEPSPASEVSVEELQVGAPGVPAVQRIAITEGAYGGSFTISHEGATTSPIAYNATAEQVQAALTSIPAVGSGNVSVSPAPRGWDVSFIGERTGPQPLMTGSASGLLVPQYLTGNIVIGTAGIFSLNYGQDGVARTTIEIQLTPHGGEPFTAYLSNTSVVKSLISPGSLAGAPLPSYPTVSQADARYLRRVPGLPAQADGYLLASEKGAADGVADLDATGKVPLDRIPDSVLGQVEYRGGWNADTNTPDVTSAPEKGWYYVVTVAGASDPDGGTRAFEPGDWIVFNGTTWDSISATDVPGPPGAAATIEIGDVETVPYGTPASVTNTGTEQAAVLGFEIPRGRDAEPDTITIAAASGAVPVALTRFAVVSLSLAGGTTLEQLGVAEPGSICNINILNPDGHTLSFDASIAINWCDGDALPAVPPDGCIVSLVWRGIGSWKGAWRA